MIAFWILLILSAFYFALLAWEKRTDSDSDNHRSTNDAYRKRDSDDDPGNDSDPGNAPGGYDGGVDAEGVKGEDMWGRESPWDSDQGSDARGPDPYYNNPPEEVSASGGGSGNGGHDEDDDDAMQSSQAENMSLGPESEHATPKPMIFLENLFKGPLRLRPRNSGSGAVGTPKRELQGTIDIRAYVSDSSLPLQTTQVTNILTLSSMVRARATSASSVIGGRAVMSVHDLPGRLQNRKKFLTSFIRRWKEKRRMLLTN